VLIKCDKRGAATRAQTARPLAEKQLARREHSDKR
jgi:hypothetical protein